MARSIKRMLIIIIAIACISAVITLFPKLFSQKPNNMSKYKEDFENYQESFERAAEYMIRTDGRINIDRLRDHLYGYSSESPEELYKPNKTEEEAINLLLFELNYRTIKTIPSGSIMIVKTASNGIERGLMKLNGKEFPLGIINKEYIKDDWYVYSLSLP